MGFDLATVTTSDWIQIAVAVVSAGAAGASAYFASKIYELTQRQLGASNRQADISARQAEIAAQQTAITESMAQQAHHVFVLGNRPRVTLDNLTFANPDPNPFTPGRIPTIRVELINSGGTAARIQGSGCFYIFRPEGIPPHPVYIRNNEHPFFNLEVGSIIEPGQSKAAYYPDEQIAARPPLPQSVLNQQLADEFNTAQGASGFFVLGWVSYVDEVGIPRVTRFARRWDGAHRRFVVQKDAYFDREA
ncbi:hypothetical protein [Methylobacterium sp. SI9]|uniref:hypothetical protein n=1 Tax=Methylobacterium guangdongense TaxID=3138811 RepID=UPI00313DDADE